MTDRVVELVNAASERWQAFFNAGDATGCASCYKADVKMVAAPFGNSVSIGSELACPVRECCSIGQNGSGGVGAIKLLIRTGFKQRFRQLARRDVRSIRR